MAHNSTIRMNAVREYQQGILTGMEIARKYGISSSVLSQWAKKAGLAARSRGRRKLKEPNARQKRILELAETYSYTHVGKLFGIAKQAVHQIVKRWQGWVKPKKPMFKPGDVILWRGERLTVVMAKAGGGVVLDHLQRRRREFRWNQSGKCPKKVGVDKKYATRGKTGPKRTSKRGTKSTGHTTSR